MAIDTTALVMDLDLTKGSIKDLSGNSNDGTFIGTSSEFLKGNRGWGYQAQSTDRIQVSANSSFDTDTMSVFFLLDLDKEITTASQILYYKRDIAGAATKWGISITNGTTITLVNSGGNATFTIATSDYFGAKTMAITKTSGSSAPELYFDGVHVATGSASITLDTTSVAVSIGGRS